MKAKKMTVSLLCMSALILPALAGCSNNSSAATESSTTAKSTSSSDSFFTTDTVHSISIDVDDDALKEALTAYQNDGSKNWVEATVTIDGETFENVGLKLKGNSTLRSVAKQSSEDIDASELPWVIRLDKYEDDQSYKGRTKFVVRGSNTESSLNEAVALAMLNESGLDAEDSAFTRFSVNGSDESLRLVIDVPDDDLWTEDHFGTNGLLYKAQSDGDYSYQGTDAASYEDSFEQKYGDDDMTPLITFLDFINNSTDEEFSENLSDYLDVDEFATYLAMQDLVANSDDIDGPGNNAYLYYDTDSKKMTVVAWDQNLSFGGMGSQGGNSAPMGGNGGKQGEPSGEMPSGEMSGGNMGTPPDKIDGQTKDETRNSDSSNTDETAPSDSNGTDSETTDNGQQPKELPNGQESGNRGGMNSKENALVTRFLANETFSALVDEKKSEYTESIVDSNFAEETLSTYKELLAKEASDLIDEETITKEAETISNYLSGDTVNKTSKKNEDNTTTKESTSA